MDSEIRDRTSFENNSASDDAPPPLTEAERSRVLHQFNDTDADYPKDRLIHELFERQGEDLFCEVPIKFTLASLGGTVEVPTLFGKATLKIPAATQSGTTFRLRGKGMPSLRGGHQGDQLVRVHVEVPQTLSSEQRRLLEEFGRISGDAAEPTSRSFFEKAKKFF